MGETGSGKSMRASDAVIVKELGGKIKFDLIVIHGSCHYGDCGNTRSYYDE